jgi:hypothetical protein
MFDIDRAIVSNQKANGQAENPTVLLGKLRIPDLACDFDETARRSSSMLTIAFSQTDLSFKRVPLPSQVIACQFIERRRLTVNVL